MARRKVIKDSIGRKIFLAVNATFLIIFALICLVPFFNILAISLSDAGSVDNGSVGLIPTDFNISAYKYLIKNEKFWTSFGYSVLRVVLGTVISLVVNILAAYPLSRPKKQFKGRKIYVALLVVTMFFNGGIVPTYIVVTKLHLYNTIWALILPIALNAWNIVLIVSFFKEIPHELIEAAEMDGASQYQILFRIVVPMSLPVIATVTLFTAVAHWNNWFDGIIYMNPDKFPLQSYIYSMINEINTLTQSDSLTPEQLEYLASLPGKTLRSAQIFISMVPIMLVYPFVQKYFVKGLTQGGVKE